MKRNPWVRRLGVPTAVALALGGVALARTSSGGAPGTTGTTSAAGVAAVGPGGAESVSGRRPETERPAPPKVLAGHGGLTHLTSHAHGKIRNPGPAVRPETYVSALVELSTAPVVVQQHASGGTLGASAARLRVSTEQAAKASELRAAGATVEGGLTHVVNAVRVRVRARDLDKVAAIPGVRLVQVTKKFHLENAPAAAYTGVDRAWAGRYTGAGTVIGVIDTGIDYTHADFGGPGTVAAYRAAEKVAGQTPPASMFPTAKVIGGWDFVGDAYDAGDPAHSTPAPDPNPIPCGDHGTHVAGTAAGAGVTKDGKAFAGPYDASTLSKDFSVAPGAAPEARLRSYKVFGCDGTVGSDVIVAAIDRAVSDGVDVINMSLGSDLGGRDDVETEAVDNATTAGVLVVASAGNAGPNAYLTGTPASADTALSVAAMDASTPDYPGAELALPGGGGTLRAIDANGATFSTFTADVVLAGGKAGSLGCDAADYTGTTGKIVVTVRGTCPRVDRVVFAQKAGAAAVIMINNTSGLPPFEGPVDGVTIPFLGVAPDGPIDALNAARSLTIRPARVKNPGYHHDADFTSAGPRRGDNVLKPDITAPGVSVLSAGMGTGTGGISMSGTSMASPHTAGIAALVRQAHPTWTPLQAKAALISTANPSKVEDYATAGGPTRGGTGLVQAARATSTVAYASTPDGRDNLSFGFVPFQTLGIRSKNYQITNTSAAPISYDLTTDLTTSSYGAQLLVSPRTVTVPAKGSSSVTLTIAMSPSAIAGLPPAGASNNGALTTLAGTVVATPRTEATGVYPLRTAFLLLPKGVSDVKAHAIGLSTGEETPTGTLVLTNAGLHPGTAHVFAWTQTDPADDVKSPDVPDVIDAGVASVPASTAGVTTGDQLLIFAVNTARAGSARSGQEIDVLIDTNGDGKPEYESVLADAGMMESGAASGALGVFTLDIRDKDKSVLVDRWNGDAPANASVAELPVLASAIGLTKEHGTFSFTVSTYSMFGGDATDSTASATFDAFTPAVSAGERVDLASLATKTVPVTVDRSRLSAQTAKGWLIVTTDDAAGRPEAERVPLRLS